MTDLTPLPFAEPMPSPEAELPPTFREKFHSLRAAMGEDFDNNGILLKTSLLLSAASLAFENGFGNELVTPLIAGQAVQHTSELSGIAKVAAIAGGYTLIEQLLTGGIVALTSSRLPHLARATYAMTQDTEHPELSIKPWKELPWLRRTSYTLSLGATFVATRESVVTNDVELRHSLPRVAKASVIIGSAVAAIAASVKTIDYYTETAPEPIHTAGDITVFTLSQPYLWVGLFGLTVYSAHRERKQLKQAIALKKQNA